MYRDGAALWIERSAWGRVTVVGTAASVTALLRGASAPDVVLLDPWLADGSDPHDNVAALVRAGAAVLAHGGEPDPETVRGLLRAGAVGYVRKSAPLADLIAAVLAASRAEPYVEPRLAYAALTALSPARPRLSAREVEVLRAVGTGRTRTAVARRLGITEGTVKTHLDRIRRKYADAGRPAHTPLELYQRGVADGLIPVPGR